MKTILIPLFFVASLYSCSSKSSFEDDVKKMAQYRCEMQKLLAKGPDDASVEEEAKELRKKMESFSEKMLEKYKDRLEDKQMEKEAERITEEEMKKCK